LDQWRPAGLSARASLDDVNDDAGDDYPASRFFDARPDSAVETTTAPARWGVWSDAKIFFRHPFKWDRTPIIDHGQSAVCTPDPGRPRQFEWVVLSQPVHAVPDPRCCLREARHLADDFGRPLLKRLGRNGPRLCSQAPHFAKAVPSLLAEELRFGLCGAQIQRYWV